MEAQGYATEKEVAAATDAKLGVTEERPASGTSPGFAPYFVEAVRAQLEERFGDELYTSRLRVHTTLDQTAQKAAEEELAAQLRRIERGTYGRFRAGSFDASSGAGQAGSEYLQGAVVMMEAATGNVVALVGGRDWAHSRFDRALVGRRQAGSAFKPFVYAAALSAGYAPSQPVADRPFSLSIPGSRTWEPRNFDNRFDGMMSMRHALAQSRNVPAARVAAAVGVAGIAQLAHRAGIVSDIPEQPAMALGVASVSPLELVTAYTAFAAGGIGSEPRFITSVENRDSAVVFSSDVVHREVLEPAVAFVLTSMLGDVVDRGTARSVRSVGFGGAAAGKTGTTTDGNDAWFIGYTPDLVGGVWIGFDQPRPIVSNASGGSLAAPVWGRMMRRVYANRRSPADWRAPVGVVARRVDPATGLVLADDCFPREAEATREFFIASAKPRVVCPRREERRRRGWLADIIGALADGLGFSRDDPAYQEYEAILASQDAPRTKEEQLLGARRLPLEEEGGGRRVEVRSDRDQRRRLAGPTGR
jgi:penicillin-binding protein 1A